MIWKASSSRAFDLRPPNKGFHPTPLARLVSGVHARFEVGLVLKVSFTQSRRGSRRGRLGRYRSCPELIRMFMEKADQDWWQLVFAFYSLAQDLLVLRRNST